MINDRCLPMEETLRQKRICQPFWSVRPMTRWATFFRCIPSRFCRRGSLRKVIDALYCHSTCRNLHVYSYNQPILRYGKNKIPKKYTCISHYICLLSVSAHFSSISSSSRTMAAPSNGFLGMRHRATTKTSD